MTKYVEMVFFLVCVLTGGLVSAAGVGLVLDITGSARADVSGQSQGLDIAASLKPGMRIDLDKGSEISFVFYPTRQQFTAVGPAALQISDMAVKQLQGAAMKTKSLPENRSSVALGFQDRVVPAAMVMRAIVVKPKPLEPMDGETVLTERPEFVWTPVGAGESLVFSLTLDGATVHQQKIDGTRLALPAALSLQSGREYRWQVVLASGDKAAKWGSFTVANANVRQQVRADQPAAGADLADWVLYAMELDQLQMKSDANRVWKRVADQRPASDKVKELAR